LIFIKKIYNWSDFIIYIYILDNKNLRGEVIDFFKDLIVIIIIVVFIRTFLIEPFQISGQSMYPTYYDREFIIVDRFSSLDIPVIKN
jgi:signal peptidase I